MIAAPTRRRFLPEAVVAAAMTRLAAAGRAAGHAAAGHAHSAGGLAGGAGRGALGLAIAAAAIGGVVWPRWRDGRRREYCHDPFAPEPEVRRGRPMP